MKTDKDFNKLSKFIDIVYSAEDDLDTVITFSHCGRDLKMIDAICKFAAQIEDIDYLQFRIKLDEERETITWLDLGEDREFLDDQFADNMIMFSSREDEEKQGDNSMD